MLLKEGLRLQFDFVMKVCPKGWGDFLCGRYFQRVETAVLTSLIVIYVFAVLIRT